MYPMVERWNSLRAGSFSSLLEDATEPDRDVYERDEKFYRKLGSVNRKVFLKKFVARDRLSDLEEGVRLLDEALQLRPHDTRAARTKEDFEDELKMLRQHPRRGSGGAQGHS